MAKYIKADIWSVEEALKALGFNIAVGAATNCTRVKHDGTNMQTSLGCGSMSAGTSLELATRHPEVEHEYEKAVFRGHSEGVWIAPNLEGTNVTYLCIGVKDVWWQEYPKDYKRILYHVKRSTEDLMKLAKKFDYMVIPLLATGFGRMPEDEVLPILDALPDNVLICSKPDKLNLYGTSLLSRAQDIISKPKFKNKRAK